MNNETLHMITDTFSNMVSEFSETFEKKMTAMETSQHEARGRLCFLHKNYKRLLLRTGYTDAQVTNSFEKARQQQVRVIRKKLKRVRQDILFAEQTKEPVYGKTTP